MAHEHNMASGRTCDSLLSSYGGRVFVNSKHISITSYYSSPSFKIAEQGCNVLLMLIDGRT
jgi:hypothetical protein